MIKRLNTDSLLSKIHNLEEARNALPVVEAVAACFSEPSRYRSAEEYHNAGQHGFFGLISASILRLLAALRVCASAFLHVTVPTSHLRRKPRATRALSRHTQQRAAEAKTPAAVRRRRRAAEKS